MSLLSAATDSEFWSRKRMSLLLGKPLWCRIPLRKDRKELVITLVISDYGLVLDSWWALIGSQCKQSMERTAEHFGALSSQVHRNQTCHGRRYGSRCHGTWWPHKTTCFWAWKNWGIHEFLGPFMILTVDGQHGPTCWACLFPQQDTQNIAERSNKIRRWVWSLLWHCMLAFDQFHVTMK